MNRHHAVRHAVFEAPRFAIVAIAIVEAEVEVRRASRSGIRACRARLRASRDRRRVRSSSVIRAVLGRRVDRLLLAVARISPIATVRPSGVSCTSRVNCRALRTRSPSYSTTTSPALMPAFSAGLSSIALHRSVHRRRSAALGIDVADHHAELAARPSRTITSRRYRRAVRPGRASGRSGSKPRPRSPATSPRQNTPNFRFFIAKLSSLRSRLTSGTFGEPGRWPR